MKCMKLKREFVMHKRITFRNMDSSEVMKEYADGQLKKIETFLANEPTPIYIDLVFEPSKVREHHRVELRIKTAHYDLVSQYEHEGVPFYDIVDRVIDTMYKELREEKAKQVDDRKVTGRKEEFKRQR
jgi:ribosomal subunit interface protein